MTYQTDSSSHISEMCATNFCCIRIGQATFKGNTKYRFGWIHL